MSAASCSCVLRGRRAGDCAAPRPSLDHLPDRRVRRRRSGRGCQSHDLHSAWPGPIRCARPGTGYFPCQRMEASRTDGLANGRNPAAEGARSGLRLRQGNQPNILAARDPGNRSRPTGAWRTGARGQGASGMLRATEHPCRVVVRTVRGAVGLGEVEACLQVLSRGSLAPDQPMVTKTMTPAARAATAIPAKNIAGPATKSIMHCSSPIIRSPPCSFSFGAARDADGSACNAVLAKHAGPVDSPVLAGDG